MILNKHCALIVVDMQKDFIDGSLKVSGAHDIILPINVIMAKFKAAGATIVATRDWHPSNHMSFDQWPEHCVSGTEGAELHKILIPNYFDLIINKGTNRLIDSYGAFHDNEGNISGLEAYLTARGIRDVFVCGLTGDFCVGWTATQAARYFNSFIVSDLTRQVNANFDMYSWNVDLVNSEDFVYVN